MNKKDINEYIVQIKRHGSLTKAAKSLNISQPALSMGLTQLEKELGFSVFDRKSVPIVPTPLGELYLEYLEKKEALKVDYFKRINDLSRTINEHVSVGGPNVYVNTIIADAIEILHRENPDISISVQNDTVPELINMAENSVIDCFVTGSKVNNEMFENVYIKNEIVYLCVPAKYEINKLLKERKGVIDYHDLEGLPFIFLKDDQPMQVAVNDLMKRRGLSLRHSVTVNQVSTSLALAARGVGMCFASDMSLKMYENNNSIVTYALEDIFYDRNIYVCYHKDKYISGACQLFIQTLTGGRK